MKTYTLITVLIVLLLSLCSGFINAQEEEPRKNPLLQVFRTQTGNATPNDKVSDQRKAFQNIQRIQKRITVFRALGKTNEEINKILSPEASLSGTGTITGTVYSSDGVTTDSRYASVYLYDEAGSYASYAYVSSLNGTYKFTSIVPGKYYVCLNGLNGTEQYYNGVAEWQQATLVQVEDGLTTAGINFVRKLFTAFVSGYVLNSSGKPIRNCSVYANNELYAPAIMAVSDSTGYYLLGPIKSGSYRLWAQMTDEQNYMDKYYKSADNYFSGDFINVRDNDTLKDYNFRLSPGGVIEGTILGEAGDTLKHYICDLVSSDNERYYNEDYSYSGKFIFSGLKPGTYKINCKNNDMDLNCAEIWYDRKTCSDEAFPLIINATDSIMSLKVIFPRGVSVSGRVNYSIPFFFDGSYIDAFDKDKNIISSGKINSDGTFIVTRLAPGEYKLFFNTYYYYSATGDEPVDLWYPDAIGFNSAEPVMAKADNETNDISFNLKQGGSISGSVYGSDNKLLPSSGKVYAYDENGSFVSSSKVDFMGRFTVAKLPAGKYKLAFTYSMPDEAYVYQWYPGTQDYSSASPVNVAAPGAKQDISLHLKKHGFLYGFLKSENNSFLSSNEHNIEVIFFDAATGNYKIAVPASFNGGYSANLLEGSYKMAFLSLFFNSSDVPEDSLAITYFSNAGSFSDPLSKTVRITADSNNKLADFIVSKAYGSISGKLTMNGAAANSLDAYQIIAYDEQGYVAKLSVYASSPGLKLTGAYKLCGLRPGKYYILAVYSFVNPDVRVCKWYNSSVRLNEMDVLPKMKIDNKAVPVTVGNSETPEINIPIESPTGIFPASDGRNIYSFQLNQNYPNPFNPSTTIQYELPENGKVSLIVYDILGRVAAELIKGEQSAGKHEIEFNASGLASGIYIYRLQAGNNVESRKFIFLK